MQKQPWEKIEEKTAQSPWKTQFASNSSETFWVKSSCAVFIRKTCLPFLRGFTCVLLSVMKIEENYMPQVRLVKSEYLKIVGKI